MVYFVEAVGAGLVKIGFTDGDPEARIRQLQTGCPKPLRLRVAVAGDMGREKEFHRQFEHLRESGEWFRLTIELEAYMAVAKFVLPRVRALEDRVEGFFDDVLPEIHYRLKRFTALAEEAENQSLYCRHLVEDVLDFVNYPRHRKPEYHDGRPPRPAAGHDRDDIEPY